MRLRTAAAAGTLAIAAPLALGGVAQAQGDKDCTDFSSQSKAQQAFDKQNGDPHRLDADDDQKACETWPPGSGNPSNAGDGDTGGEDGTQTPDGSVDAGGGGAAGDPADYGPALAVAAGLGLTAGGTVLARRRRTTGRTDADS